MLVYADSGASAAAKQKASEDMLAGFVY